MDDKSLDQMSLDELEYTMLVDHPTNILVVDDEDVIRMVFDALLANTSYDVGYAESAEQALSILDKEAYDLLIVDKNLPGESGLDLVRKARSKKPDSEFILITGYASYESAIEALRLGAFDYLEKPFSDLVLVKEKIDRAVGRQRLLHENVVLADQLRSVHKDLQSKSTALHLTRGTASDPVLLKEYQRLRDRLGRATRSLQQAFSRYQALVDNRLIPEGPAKQILELLENCWAELAGALQIEETAH
jgi:DNA-binding response OmpR family regulator